MHAWCEYTVVCSDYWYAAGGGYGIHGGSTADAKGVRLGPRHETWEMADRRWARWRGDAGIHAVAELASTASHL